MDHDRPIVDVECGLRAFLHGPSVERAPIEELGEAGFVCALRRGEEERSGACGREKITSLHTQTIVLSRGARPLRQSGTPGGRTSARRLPVRPSTWRPRSRVIRISTTTVRGARSPSTAMSGRRRALRSIGRPIMTAAGCGLRPGAGPGSTMRPGATRRFTTVDGRACANTGAGCRVRGMSARSMHRRWWAGWARPA